MGRRADLSSVMIIGSGPIVIGQSAEFDYSGVQACKVLRAEGLRVILVNSNPATIMTDPDFADRTYLEPLDPETVEAIIAIERPDALLPTLGGQTALNVASALHESGALARHGVELIGASYEAIRLAEDREAFRGVVERVGLRTPRSVIARTLDEARAALAGGPEGALSLPAIVRPAYTLGGKGGGAARTAAEFDEIVAGGLDASPIRQVLVEESVLGWGEFELEVMRDHADNCVVVCAIENVDPMGVHTGDSVTVAPAMTLTDPQLQRLRDAALAILREVGVDTGGSNVQFAFNRDTDDLVVIEMNPRVSRSSALASKATGYPIAAIAAKLAIGYTLDEIPNDITKMTPACFEPALDYVVVKMPRFAFEKFRGADPRLTTHMKAVGEVMAIGRTFAEAFGKALRSRELDRAARAFSSDLPLAEGASDRFDRLFALLEDGADPRALAAETTIHPFFVEEFARMVAVGRDRDVPVVEAKRHGLSDGWIARLRGLTEAEVRAARPAPAYKAVDSCAAEFAADTRYLYSAYEGESDRPGAEGPPRVLILGSGPVRIGQGIEFDYCCVHAAQEVRAAGRQAVMVNCNPETVSTDYDTSDILYFEPLTVEDVREIVARERPEGVIAQFGGQTPLRLAGPLAAEGVRILGTPPEAIAVAEDRERFGALLTELALLAPPYGTATTPAEAIAVAARVGYPVLARPSFVLGGRSMVICYEPGDLDAYLADHPDAFRSGPLLVDRFLEDAIEIDVDALCDADGQVWVAAIMQHVEEAGIHSGDSACVLPALSLGDDMLALVAHQTRALGRGLGAIGLLNVQFALRNQRLYVIEANPRASRTVPFVSKAIGLPLAKLATRLCLGESLADLALPAEGSAMARRGQVAVKEAVMPFDRFAGVDTLLGPEMRSTGEVMGIAADFPGAFAKAQRAAGQRLPLGGTAFLTVADTDKSAASLLGQQLLDLGFRLVATRGTAAALRRTGLACDDVNKVQEGSPHVVDLVAQGLVDLIVNTPVGRGARPDGYAIRRAALVQGVPCITTMAGAAAAVRAITALRRRPAGEPMPPVCLQDLPS